MSKKGAVKTGSGGGRKAKDAAMAKRLPPSPDVRKGGWSYPYHSNMGTSHRRPSGED